MLTTITLVEDDKTFAGLLKKIIDCDTQMSCVSIYSNTETALSEFSNKPTDVIIMDIQLPDGNGISLTKHFKKQFPDTYIIMCTSFDDDEKVFDSLKAGANGYIVKLDNPETIVNAIHEVIHGGAPMSMGIAKKVIQYFRQLDVEKEKLDILSNKENELLNLLAKGMLYKEIADQMQIGLDTVKKHCGNIYRKLHVSNKTEAINLLLKR